jgi:hypothetical protein
MFQSSLWPPPGVPIRSGVTRMVLRVLRSESGVISLVRGVSSDCSWDLIVAVTRLRTSGAWDSVKVRFSMVHMKGDTGGAKGIAKKVTCGVDQQWPEMRVWMAGCGIAVTMKHQGAV